LTQVTATVTGLNQSVTIDFDSGNIHIIDLQGATGTLTVAFSNAQAGAEYKVFFINPLLYYLDIKLLRLDIFIGYTFPL
jgi:hypothetical protein